MRHKNEIVTNKLKYKLYIITFLALLCIVPRTFSQGSVRDTALNMHIFQAHYDMFWPGGDMADRFGRGNSIGLNYAYKFRYNLFFELSYSYLWGDEVKENNILDGLKTSSGNIIDNQGYLNPVALELRGHGAYMSIGKLFPVIGPNPNSGLFFSVGGGFLQHKIDFSYLAKTVTQVSGDYAKGYDRLSNGFAIKVNIGFLRVNDRYLNWSLGFECVQAFTQNRRDWNIDTRQKDTTKRIDLMFGLNLRAVIPFYKRTGDVYYF